MQHKNLYWTIIFCLTALAAQAQQYSFDKDWKFYPGDIAFPILRTHGESYESAKAGKAWGAAAPEYNDRQWRRLQLPHDWASESGFDSTENVSQGYRKRGIGWYRKSFKLPLTDNGKHLELQFEGIATFATVWFNGTLVARNWSGYSSFYIDITSLAKYGDDLNTIAIRVDANAMEGWWYEGAGIYRHTWLVKRHPLHIITDGVYAHPVKTSTGNWLIPVEATLNNVSENLQQATIVSKLLDDKGREVAQGSGQMEIAELKTGTVKFPIAVSNPQLWSLENPVLYKVVTTVMQNGKIVDEVTTPCGFRTLRFDADRGFFLNEKHVPLQGVCNHQDHAGVGVAIPDALWEFRLKKLKELGVNAYRCSHNAPPKRLLQLCDSMGILVMDENRNFNVSPEYMNQLEWMVRRDRNHPSIILWSVFNEEPMQGSEQGYQMVRRMSALVKSLDTTRPVTAAMNGGLFTEKNVSDAVDVVGFNYQIWAYDKFRQANPHKKLTSSEDISSFQIRGEYHTDKQKNIIDDYDSEGAPWGSTQRAGWKEIAERPWLAGSFIWTGFDYHGEPTPLVWPTNSSVFGLLDLCGFPKNAAYIKQAQWRHDTIVLNMVPHWNWPADSMGKPIKVMVSSNADEVDLLVNGKSAGKQTTDKYQMNTWHVPYKPGSLMAIAYKNGKKIAQRKIETTGPPVALKLEAYKNNLYNDGMDATPITVKALDAKGREVPTANLMVQFSINNNAQIIGLGNGNPNSHEPEKGNQRSLFNGLAQVIIQSVEGTNGYAELMATAPGLKPATLKIPLQAVALPLQWGASTDAIQLSNFRMAPFSTTKPDATLRLSDNDMNSWQPVKPGELVNFGSGSYTLFSTGFELNNLKNSNGKIKLENVVGKAELWLDDKKIFTKDEANAQAITVPFTASNGKHRLVIVIEARPQSRAGLGGMVEVHVD